MDWKERLANDIEMCYDDKVIRQNRASLGIKGEL